MRVGVMIGAERGDMARKVAKLIADIGFEGVYVSGAVLSADLGLPDIGLTTLSEVAARGGSIARATDLPTLIDAVLSLTDTFGLYWHPATLVSRVLTMSWTNCDGCARPRQEAFRPTSSSYTNCCASAPVWGAQSWCTGYARDAALPPMPLTCADTRQLVTMKWCDEIGRAHV